MGYVCFTGHRKIENVEANKLKLILAETIKRLLNKGIRVFYTAEAGDFDILVLETINEYKTDYPDIVIIALHGRNKAAKTKADIIKKLNSFAVEYKVIISKSEYLICYVNEIGCALNLMIFAEKNGIKVHNLAD